MRPENEEHALRIQLATALKERDDARALAEKWILREAACVERGIRADADALSEIQGLQEALAAARRECDLLKAMLRDVRPLVNDAFMESGALTERDWETFLASIDAALATSAAAAGEEGTR